MIEQQSGLHIDHCGIRLQHHQILDDVHLHLKTGGHIIGLIGPNGAGKSTLFKCIMGFETRYEGNIHLDGVSLHQLQPSERSRAGLGYLPQESWLFEDYNVWQNLQIFAENDPQIQNNMNEAITQALDKMNLLHLKKEIAKNLSGGEKRRLEFARTLLYQPKIILLDEPFTGIDPITIREISQIMVQLKDQGVSILISDHQAEKILNLVDETIVLYQGKVLAQGTSEEIRSLKNVRDLYLGWD
jgi:lipopolysaccharide export system ATP-binding protein